MEFFRAIHAISPLRTFHRRDLRPDRLGFAIIYNSTGIINFAQGEFVMLGGMLDVYFFRPCASFRCRWPLLLAVVAATAVGVLFERLAIRPLRSATPLSLVIITIGGSILIRGMAMLIWGKDTHALPAFSGNEPISMAGATMLPQHLWIFGITCCSSSSTSSFFNYTITGKAMRACAFNRRAASLVGIDVRRMVLFSFCHQLRHGSPGRDHHRSPDHDLL